jgi:hypothetical protein
MKIMKKIGIPLLAALLFASPVLARHRDMREKIAEKRPEVQDDDALKSDAPAEVPDEKDATQYKHFVAHNKTMTCSADEHALPFNNAIRYVTTFLRSTVNWSC